jgi:NAD(P)-dependent dehydrogenase (short-subunit alcohol dehydrogenase family)
LNIIANNLPVVKIRPSIKSSIRDFCPTCYNTSKFPDKWRMPMELKGKVAIVTGAGRGLGRAAAIAMARAGANLVIVSRTPRELEETAALIIEGGSKVAALQGDLSRPEDITRTVKTAMETFGAINILMNNAAVIGPMKPCHELTGEEWKFAIDVDLMAPILLTKEVVPSMIRPGGGKIINVLRGWRRSSSLPSVCIRWRKRVSIT